MKLNEEVDKWLDVCPTDVEIIEEFDNSMWVKVRNPWDNETKNT